MIHINTHFTRPFKTPTNTSIQIWWNLSIFLVHHYYCLLLWYSIFLSTSTTTLPYYHTFQNQLLLWYSICDLEKNTLPYPSPIKTRIHSIYHHLWPSIKTPIHSIYMYTYDLWSTNKPRAQYQTMHQNCQVYSRTPNFRQVWSWSSAWASCASPGPRGRRCARLCCSGCSSWGCPGRWWTTRGACEWRLVLPGTVDMCWNMLKYVETCWNRGFEGEFYMGFYSDSMGF